MAILSTNLFLNGNTHDRILKLTNRNNYFSSNSKVEVVEPEFDYKSINQNEGRIKTVIYLCKQFKSWSPDVVLSFGDIYNSISIISSFGFRIPVFVLNSMNPNLYNGIIIDIIIKSRYPLAAGIIAQIDIASSLYTK